MIFVHGVLKYDTKESVKIWTHRWKYFDYDYGGYETIWVTRNNRYFTTKVVFDYVTSDGWVSKIVHEVKRDHHSFGQAFEDDAEAIAWCNRNAAPLEDMLKHFNVKDA